jgi:hypothetical protein
VTLNVGQRHWDGNDGPQPGPARAAGGEAGRSAGLFDTRKATALLALLAVTGREQSREQLADLLWPEADRAKGRASLRRTLSVTAAAARPGQATGRCHDGETGLPFVLTAAAVLGSDNDTDLLRAVSGRGEDEIVEVIDEALARSLLAEIPPPSPEQAPSYGFPYEALRRIPPAWP